MSVDTIPKHEEADVVRLAQGGCKRSRSQLVESVRPWAEKVAKRYSGPALPFEDLRQEALVGVVVALDKFEPSRGVRFITYANWWIRATIFEYMRRNFRAVALPKQVASAANREVRANDKITAAELREVIGGSEAKAADLIEFIHGSDSSAEFTVLHGECVSPEDAYSKAVARAVIGAAVGRLSDSEQDVIRRRAYSDDPETFVVVGEARGVCRERVRQIEARALKKLGKMKVLRELAEEDV